jgi:hypothetical protein
MTWTPPPESERPDGYKCLGQIQFSTHYDFVWIECVWRKEGGFWHVRGLDYYFYSVEEPVRFSPLPDEAAARIAALEAEVARLTNNANAIERENKWLRGNCDASPDGVHTVIHEGRYRFCGKCGETITPDKLRMAERFKQFDLLEAEVARLREALKECADDLESYVNQEYTIEQRDKYPNMEAKYARDMAPVAKARAALGIGKDTP